MPESPQTESPQSENQVQPAAVQLAQQVAARLAEFATDVVLCPGSRNARFRWRSLRTQDCGCMCAWMSAAQPFWRWGWRACSSGMLRW